MDGDIEMYRKIQEEIKYRELLIEKRRNRIKLSLDEKKWLATHSCYNMNYDQLTYFSIIETLKPRRWYSLDIVTEFAFSDEIFPVFSVPAGKGKIVTDFNVYDYQHILNPKREVKILSFENLSNTQVRYFSDFGKVEVYYGCQYAAPWQGEGIIVRANSQSGMKNFGIQKEDIFENKVRYYCKHPMRTTFDSLIFTMEWKEMENQ